MKLKIDGNIPPEAAGVFRAAGHDAVTVADQGIRGAPDDRLGEVARGESRVLVTLDVGFADIRRHPPRLGAGTIVLRLHKQGADAVLEVCRRVVHALETEPIDGCLWVVDESRIRLHQ